MSTIGQLPTLVVTFRFQETVPASIRWNGRFAAANLDHALAQPGQVLFIAVTFCLRGSHQAGRGGVAMPNALSQSFQLEDGLRVTRNALDFFRASV